MDTLPSNSKIFKFPQLSPAYQFNSCNDSELTCLSNSSTTSFWPGQADYFNSLCVIRQLGLILHYTYPVLITLHVVTFVCLLLLY